MSQNTNNGGSGPPSVTLWVKAEPFTYGALPAAPHPRLSFHVSADMIGSRENVVNQPNRPFVTYVF